MAIKFLSGLNLSNVTAGSILKLDSNGNIVAATAGTDYATSSLWTTAGQGGVNINKDVRIGTYSSDVLPEARLHVYEYQTTDPKILIEDGNTGDASMQFKISTQSYTMGIDNSDSDKFVLAASSALGTTNVLEISTLGTSAFQEQVLFNKTVNLPGDGTSSREVLINAHGTRGKLMKEGNATYWQVAQGGNQFEITDAANGNDTKGNVMLRVHGNDANDNEIYLAVNSGRVGIGTTSPSYTLHVNGSIGAKPLDYKFILGTNQQDSYSYGTMSANMPLNGYLWHDLLAFDRHYTRTQEVSSDGSTWSSTSLQTALFNQKQDQSIEVISSSNQAVRWTFQGVAWALPDFLNLAFTYASPSNNKTVLVESSADGSTWTTRHTSTVSGGISTKTCYISSYGGQTYLRVTVAKATSNTDIVRMSSLKLMTSRAGDQGQGSEYQYPYSWDSQRNMAIGTNSVDSNFGLTVGGNLKISGTGIASKATIEINNSSSSTFNHTINALAANLAAGENNIFIVGKAASTKNSGYIGYKYSSAGSNNNVLTFGHWGSDNLMNLTGDGNLGIGTTSPDTKLEVNGQASFGDNSTLAINNDAFVTVRAAGFAGIDVKSLRTSGNIGGLRAYDSNGTGQGQLLLKVDGGLEFYNSASRLYITSGGNVGIGTANPSQTLHVVGDIYTTSDFRGNSIISANAALTISNTGIQPDQGDVEDIVAFNFATTKVSHIDTDGYIHAAGFKTNTAATGFLKANGTVDTSTYLTAYTETDTLNSVTGRGATTTNNISVGNLSAVGGTFTDPVTIYDSTTTENPRLSVGRNSGESIQFSVTDVVNTITAKQDSDSDSVHTFVLDRVFGGSGDSVFSIHNDGTPDLTIDGSGVVTLNQYGTAGILKINTSGTISVDTNTYSTATGVADNADNYGSWTVSDGTNTESITSGTTVAWRGSGATSVSYNASTNQFSISSTDTQYSAATTSAAGLMSSTDKTKLDGIETSADVTDATNVAAAGALMTSGGSLTGALTINQNGSALNLRSTTNAQPSRITFSSDVPAAQIGHIEYVHSDNVSYGSGEAFIIGGNQTTTILADGKLMYKDGIYSKPSSGTGAGTRKDSNWDTAYTYSQVGHLPLSGGTVTGMTIFEDGMRIGTGNHYTDGRASITFGEGDTTSDSMYIEYDGENLNGDSNAIIFGSAKEGVGDIFRVTYGGSVLVGSNAVATESYVGTAISNLVDSAPAALDTLNELAAALGDDASFSTTMSTALGNRLRIDVNNQSLTSTQKANGRTNLGLGSAATAASTAFVAVSGDTMTGTLRLPWKWNSTDLTANSFYVQRSATEDGFAFGIGTGVSTWFSWDGEVGTKRAIDVWNDASKILLGQGGHDVEIQNDLYVPAHIFHTSDTDTYMQFHADDQWRVVTGGTERLEVNNTATTVANTLTASGGINGLTLANGGISGANYNITGVNQLEIADPGEGIVFKSGSSGDMTLAIVDDANDNILRFSGTTAKFDVDGELIATSITSANGIYHEGDTDTSITFSTDTINVNTGGGSRINITDSTTNVYNDLIIAGGETFSLGERANGDDNGRTVLIEGVAGESSGEGSGRIFFSEHNSSDAAADSYGLSLYYEGNPNAQLPSGFQPNTGNATWSLRRHDNSVNGAAIMSGIRTSNNVTFSGTVTVAGRMYVSTVDANATSTTALVLGASNEIEKRTLGTNAFNSIAYLEDISPATPSVDSTAVVGETIEITFSESSTPGVDYYQVWSAVGSSTGSYGMIAHIPQEDVASSMTVIDATFSVSDTMYYRVYAVKSGIYSTAGTANRAFSAAALDVANMSVVNLNTAYYIQYEMPDSRFVDHVEIYMDAEATASNLTRTGATLVYSGNNTSYMYKIGANDLDKYHQFWVEVVES